MQRCNIPIQFINNHSVPLTKHLFQLINRIIDSNIVPDEFKCGRVVPIHKGGSTSDVTNYRPICILPNLSKVLERVLHDQIVQYLNDHSLLYTRQTTLYFFMLDGI